MPKEWVLNSATNRFQLNFERNVGPVALNIRKCQPKTLDEWESYYYANVRPKQHLVDLGKRLYVKITEVLVAEIGEITEQDCIDYIINLVIDRTFDGYTSEISTIYGQLQQELGVAIEPAPDEWDRLFNVDFFITVNGKHIGLQIKPAGKAVYIPQIFKERDIQSRTHAEFTRRFGGKVFYVISITEGRKKLIHNLDVVDDIRREIARLSEA